jgi:hypothetical protein
MCKVKLELIDNIYNNAIHRQFIIAGTGHLNAYKFRM